MATTSYGSITIVDITDIGEFSVYPKCNLPTTVIYSPDDNLYTPNWISQNLVITPVAYYAGSPVSNNVSWLWERQQGNSARATVSSTKGETVNTTTGALTVNQNQFNGSYSQLTYIVTATYQDATLGKDLVAEGQITFSKVEQGTSAKTAKINGDNIIKYAGNGSIISPIVNNKSYITLTGTVTRCNITKWTYNGGTTAYPIKSNATPATYPNGANGNTLNVYADDDVFVNDKVTIKLQTNDTNTYDQFTIYKLRDGAAGTSTLSAILTNEDQMIPANANGSPVNIAQSGATSQIKIYRGGSNVTTSENWTITTTSDTGITFSKSTTAQTDDTVTVTSMNANLAAGNIYFTATHGNQTLNKTFSLVKVKAGADAQTFSIYNLSVDALALNKSVTLNSQNEVSTVTLNPVSFIASATETEVSPSAATTKAFAGKFRITEYSGNTSEIKYTTSSTESSKTYTPTTSNTLTKILVELLDAAGSNVLDKQTIVITSDGAKGEDGEQGPAGEDAISIILGNEAEVFACDNNNKPLSTITVRIPFGAYKGTTRVAATVNRPQLLGETASNSSTNASTASDGVLIYEIPTTKEITNASGTLALVFTCEGQTFNKVFSWTRSSAAKNGIDGVTMLLFTPNGTLFENGGGDNLTVEGYLQSGSTDITNSATWKWYQWNSTSYTELGTVTSANAYYSGKTLTIKPAAVDGYSSFKVEATYDNKTYTQYISITDKTDPIQVSVHSTLGTQLVNGQGAGALYARVTRNGTEIDPIGDSAITTGTTNPSGGNNGDHYIKLDETNRVATLYQKKSGSWSVLTPTATYEWYFRDAQNNPITNSTTLTNKFGNAYNSSTGKVTGKCLYIDKTTVDNKITVDVKVTV